MKRFIHHELLFFWKPFVRKIYDGQWHKSTEMKAKAKSGFLCFGSKVLERCFCKNLFFMEMRKN